ncbi:hypothetical protein [Guggenheimella bovis]
MKSYQDQMHDYGRMSLVLAILFFISFPLLSSILFGAWPYPDIFLKGLLAIVPIYWTVGAIEALTFGPMLGTGSYLGFVTGNLTAMKVPVSLLAMDLTETKPNTEEGDVISTIAIAISSIVTTIVIVIGMLLLNPLRPLLESPVLAPAFKNILPALFGALGVVFVAKRFKIAIAPILLMILLFILVPSLSSAVSLLVPVSAGFSVLIARILYKKGLI